MPIVRLVMTTTEKTKPAPASSSAKAAKRSHATAPSKPDVSTYKPKAMKLSARQAQELTDEGLLMRRDVEARYASMKVITEDDLKLRAR